MDDNMQPVGPEAPDAGNVGDPAEIEVATPEETGTADSEIETETEGE